MGGGDSDLEPQEPESLFKVPGGSEVDYIPLDTVLLIVIEVQALKIPQEDLSPVITKIPGILDQITPQDSLPWIDA